MIGRRRSFRRPIFLGAAQRATVRLAAMAKKKKLTRQKHVPLRTCIACRETKPKRELIRIVRLADGAVVVDETGKQNGRGAYLCRQYTCWQEALERGALSRALHAPLPPEAAEQLAAYAEKTLAEIGETD
jgi:predicted RNA-binding protein YlxR (DUF448 family)